MLKTSDRVLCICFAIISLAALYFTWSNNLAFFAMPDNGGFWGFIKGGMANPAAASLSWDLTFLTLVVCTLMVQEARRWGVRYVWLYIVFSMSIAISVMFPLFLIARQIQIAKKRI